MRCFVLNPQTTPNFQVFSRGSNSSGTEITTVSKAVIKSLRTKLWSLEDGLSYEDRSIFIEEKATVVTWTLINAVKKQAKVAVNIRVALLRCLKSILEFLETCRVNRPTFKIDFTQLITTVQDNEYMQKLNKVDLNNLRIFLWTVYSPLVNY